MTNLHEIAKTANELKMVESARVWKDKRVYVNLYDCQRSFRGDQSYQLYYCKDRGWISESGKGTMSSKFTHALIAFEAAMGIEA